MSARGSSAVGVRRGRQTERRRDGDRHERLECETGQDGSDNMNTMRKCVSSKNESSGVESAH